MKLAEKVAVGYAGDGVFTVFMKGKPLYTSPSIVAAVSCALGHAKKRKLMLHMSDCVCVMYALIQNSHEQFEHWANCQVLDRSE